MTEFKYIGDKKSLTAFGIEFPRDEFVNVDEPAIEAKLHGIRFFEAGAVTKRPEPSVKDIRALLDEMNIEYPSDAKKADLVILLDEAKK